MSDDNFPSGPWTGFYTDRRVRGRQRQDLALEFANGRITGEGRDGVGQFVVSGRYDVATRECWWTKTYVGAHDVFYRGFREGKGIWGTWEIDVHRGGFKIWPLAQGDGDGETETEEKAEPVEAVGIATSRAEGYIG